MLLNFSEFLKKNRILNLILVFGYGIALIFFHDFFVQLSVKVMNKLSLELYNRLVFVLSACAGTGFILYMIYLLRKSLKRGERYGRLQLYFLLAISTLVCFHYAFLFEMNIEVIHVLEFSIMAILLFPLCRSFGASLAFTLPFIVANEWYQYKVLYPTYIHYFEFNDIVIDLLGCGLAMLFLWIAGTGPDQNPAPLWKKPSFLMFAVFDLSFILLSATCILSFYPETQCGNTVLVLNQLENPHQFWQVHVFGAVYHVMKPWEGMIAINCIVLFFTFTDHVARNK